MKKMIFNIPDNLAEQIDEAVIEYGFINRPEFFRYLAMEFVQRSKNPDQKLGVTSLL